MMLQVSYNVHTINADFSMMGLAFKLFYNTEAGRANQHGATLVHDVNASWAILLNNVLAGSELSTATLQLKFE